MKLSFASQKMTLFGMIGRALALASCLSFVAACAQKNIVLTRSRLLMGHVPVTVRIMTEPGHRERALRASQEAYELASSLEGKISEFNPDSEISCLNRNAGREFCRISRITSILLQNAIEISEKTGNAFDVRFKSVSKTGRDGEIFVDETRHRAMLRHSDTRVGVGAIGKGLIVDEMSQFLRERGFPQHLIQAGGDLKGSGTAWKVGIQVPGALRGQHRETFTIEDEALATSGSYEQPGHIMDPRNDRAVDRLESVTVRAKDLWLADALATACFVMGKDRTPWLSSLYPDVGIYWSAPEDGDDLKTFTGPGRDE